MPGDSVLDSDIERNLARLKQILGIGKSFDVVLREIKIGGKDAALILVDGFTKDEVTVKILDRLLRLRREDILPGLVDKIVAEHLAHFEVKVTQSIDEIVGQVLSGQLVLLVDGDDQGVLIDVRQYPGRAIEEPDLERVTRGARDAFVETLIYNTALIRRRLRDPNLRFEHRSVGKRSRTDVVVGYIAGVANERLVSDLLGRLKRIEVDVLPMGSRSLGELIVQNIANPLPTIRVTERPDVVVAHIAEGHVVVLTDTSPGAMIIPANAWHFTQHAEEYFQDPLVGTYLRWIRFLGIAIATLLVPLWLALASQRELLPEYLQFLGPRKAGNVPLWFQFVLLQMGVDLIRMAFIHTPTALATSLGLVGAVLLGQLAVSVGLFAPEAILYTAISAIGFFATPNLEFALAMRLFGYVLLALTAAFNLLGLLGGLVFTFLVLTFTQSFGLPYLWPLIPLNMKALGRILFRWPVPSVRLRSPSTRPQGPNSSEPGE